MKNVVLAVLLVVSLSVAAMTWSETTPLPRGSWRHACAAANGKLYFLGGGSGPGSDCYFARVNLDGTIGSWQSTAVLPTTLGWFAADATQGHIYAAGGWNGPLTNAVSYAPLDTAGQIGAWSSTASLPIQLYTHNSILADSCFYVIGGCTGIGTPTVPDVRFARVQPGGTLGAWTETSDLPQPVRLMGVAAWDDYLYSVGGRGDWDKDATYDVVYYAKRNPDGTLGNWQSTTSLPSPVDGPTCAAVSGRLYSCGGLNGGAVSLVYSAPINPDGSVGAWVSEAPLPAARWAADGLAVNDRIYVTGGYDGNGMAEVYYSNQLTGVRASPAVPLARLASSFCSGSVRFTLPATGPVELSLVAPDGRVCRRQSFSSLAAGEHELALTGLAAGAYLLRIETASSNSTERFVVLK